MRHSRTNQPPARWRAPLVWLALFALSTQSISTAFAISAEQRRAIQYDAVYYDQNAKKTCQNVTTTSFSALAPGAKVFVIGDSLTYGMTKLGGLLDKLKAANYTVDTAFTEAGTSGAPRVYGPSVEATGGINIARTTPLMAEHTAGIAGADGIIIGLGTNREPTDFVAAITSLVSTIRAVPGFKSTARIFWINTYYTGSRSVPYTTVNTEIKTAAATNSFSIIDIATAVIGDPARSIAANPALAPNGGDGVHYSPDGYKTRSDYIVGELSKSDTAAPSTGGGGGSYDPTSLTYPPFPDEAAIASSIEAHIRKAVAANSKTATSPWFGIPNLGTWLLAESKSRGINPMIVMGAGQQENLYGILGSNPTTNNNYFGMKGRDGKYIHFDTPILGMTAFLDAIKRNIVDRSNPSYKAVTTMYEYFSVHQTGGIHYPGDGMSLGDPLMPSAWISWDSQYNPGNYWKTASGVITDITGITVSPEIPAPGGSATIGGCATSPAKGEASKYIPDCSANGGNAAIACTAINQLMGIPYSLTQRAAPTDPSPKFLDCSAFTGMAVYRAFGTDLHGLCSVSYLSNANFQQIDVHDIQTGDLVGIGAVCTGAGGNGHIAIVVSYDKANKKLITVEASGTTYPSGIRDRSAGTYNVGLKADGFTSYPYEWAVRYIGPKTLQPGAN